MIYLRAATPMPKQFLQKIPPTAVPDLFMMHAWGLTRMKLLPLTCIVWLVASCPSWADDQQKRFLEFPSGSDTKTFDLNTVQIIQPGRFSIIGTTLDDPDVMRFKLKAVATARNYCARAEGKYPAPPELFTLGPPDIPVKDIEIKHNQSNSKYAMWFYPYKRLGDDAVILFCDRQSDAEHRDVILNGIRSKHLFDCKRGLFGSFVREDDDASKAIAGSVPIGSRAFEYYLSLCKVVTHEAPYIPEK